MSYNNKLYRLAQPVFTINVSNSDTPAEFAANVFKVMESLRDPSVANAINTMAKQNATYNGQYIREIPEFNELFSRVTNFYGPITENDLASDLQSLFGNAVPR